MKYAILSSKENTDDKKIAEAMLEFMSPIDVLVIGENPPVYEKLAAMIASNKGITIQRRPKPHIAVDYSIIVYDNGNYERHKHQK